MFVGMGANSGGGYNLESSLRFRSSASAYLSRTPTSNGNKKTWTFSCWTKRGTLTGSQVIFSAANSANSQFVDVTINGNNEFELDILDSNSTRTIRTSTAVLRDPSAWYHLVLVMDTTQVTNTNRIKLYVNNELLTTSAVIGTFPNQNADTQVNATTGIHAIARRQGSADRYYDAYLTEINHVDGQALTPSDFGEYDDTTGVWKPKEYTGTYGTNGFYLPMKETQQATGFNTVLYTGTGATQSISNVGFSPDLVWIKDRNNATSHGLYDTIRGINHPLFSNSTSAETTETNASVTSTSDGMTLTGSGVLINGSSRPYVAWCWDAGSSTVSNTDGTITSSVRANPATGFSIVSYTSTTNAKDTVGHGLGSAPKIVINKKRDAANNWTFVTDIIDGSMDYLYLNTTASALDASGFADVPTSLVMSSTFGSTSSVIAYCFSEVAGYSKFGSYTGTGSSGLKITTGFRPAFVMIKRTDSANNWFIHDNTRDPDNPTTQSLYPNLSDAEVTETGPNTWNTLDDGFELLGTTGGSNASGGTYIYMAFADTRDAQFNFDASGNKNNWTANNINSNASSETTYDIMNDVPTLTDEDTGNFATLNPLIPSVPTLSSGNLDFNYSSGTAGRKTSSIAISSGKWYAEFTMTSANINCAIGVFSTDFANYANAYKSTVGGYNAVEISSGSQSGSWDISNGQILGIAFDYDAGTVSFYTNNTLGITVTGLSTGSKEFVFACGVASSGGNATTYSANFGQRPFKYTPPTGYKKLNTYNLPDSTIKDGSQYFDATAYTGNSSSLSITTEFSPDFVWIKRRNTSSEHALFDTVRGRVYSLGTNSTNAEYTTVGADKDLISFDSTGYTVGQPNQRNVNGSGQTYVGWSWRGSDSSAVSNTDGTITSTVSANPTSGFSVVTYAGTGANATVGHGLGVAPNMMIIKNRGGTNYWAVYHSSVGNTGALILSSTSATDTSSLYWNNTSPTSSVFTVQNAGAVNASGGNYVAYCFADVEGFSKFGSYTGLNNSDGPFVYLGFKPAFIMFKRTDSAQNWFIFDNTRSPYNTIDEELRPNTSDAEVTGQTNVDYLSNGFKIYSSGSAGINQAGNYIYMAFAENPFKQSLAR